MNSSGPLRVACIGDDRNLIKLLHAADRLTPIDVVGCFDVSAERRGEFYQQLRPLASHREYSDWEALLGGVADLVLVGPWPTDAAGFDRRAEQLKRLAAEGQALVLIHPACEMLLAYELEMIRSDTRGWLFPFHEGAQQPALANLVSLLKDPAAWGKREPIVWERHAAANQRTRESVMAWLASDGLILRRLLGQVKTVSAVGASEDGNDLSNLVVQLAGDRDQSARWSIGAQRDQAEVRVVVIGAARQRSLVLAPDLAVCRSVIDTSPAPTEQVQQAESQPGKSQPADTQQDSQPLAPQPHDENRHVEDFMRGVIDCLRSQSEWDGITWQEVCQTLEISDAAQRSIQRRRTIELFHEQVTEAETFKSVMAAGGCGMLMWVLFLLMVAGLADGLQVPFRHTILGKLWLIALFLPLAIFLVLQLLQLVFVRTESQPKETHRAT